MSSYRPPTRPPRAARAVVAAALAALALLLLASSPALADDDVPKMRQKIQTYTLRLADLEKADDDKSAIQEIKLAQLWITDAQTQLSRDEESNAKRLIRQVEVALDLISAQIERARVEKEASNREAAAAKMEREADNARLTLDEAKARKDQLQAEVDANANTTGGGKPQR